MRFSERQVDVFVGLDAAQAVDHEDHGRIFVQLVLLLLQLDRHLVLLQLQRGSLTRGLEVRKGSGFNMGPR